MMDLNKLEQKLKNSTTNQLEYYKEGKKLGNGKYLWSDGSQYIGDWADNRISGKGIYTWLDGRMYDGEWLNNNMHGKGCYTWKDGRKYEGFY